MLPKKERKLVKIDDDSVLKQIHENQLKDDYIIQKYFKFSALILIIIFCSSLAFLFIREAFINEEFKIEVLNYIKYNLGAIFVALFGVLGIKIIYGGGKE